MNGRVIQTQAPGKGDLVPGHKVYAIMPGDLPSVLGVIESVSKSGHAVVFRVDNALAVFGIPKRTTWTWRRSVGAYQQKGERTSRGWGLALVRNT